MSNAAIVRRPLVPQGCEVRPGPHACVARPAFRLRLGPCGSRRPPSPPGTTWPPWRRRRPTSRPPGSCPGSTPSACRFDIDALIVVAHDAWGSRRGAAAARHAAPGFAPRGELPGRQGQQLQHGPVPARRGPGLGTTFATLLRRAAAASGTPIDLFAFRNQPRAWQGVANPSAGPRRSAEPELRLQGGARPRRRRLLEDASLARHPQEAASEDEPAARARARHGASRPRTSTEIAGDPRRLRGAARRAQQAAAGSAPTTCRPCGVSSTAPREKAAPVTFMGAALRRPHRGDARRACATMAGSRAC